MQQGIKEQPMQTMLQLAEVHLDGRKEPAAALDTLCQAMALDCDDASLVSMVEQVASQLQEWERLADVLSQRAGVTPDPDLARNLFLRVAEVSRDQLKDLPRAVGAFSKALEHSADDIEILEQLDSLHERQESWRELASVTRAR